MEFKDFALQMCKESIANNLQSLYELQQMNLYENMDYLDVLEMTLGVDRDAAHQLNMFLINMRYQKNISNS
jgi:hypothetical protein